MCDKENNVLFAIGSCHKFTIREPGLERKRHKNLYKIDIRVPKGNNLTCISAVMESSLLWHKRLGHASFSLLKKLVARELILGLSKTKFSEDMICDACTKMKDVKSSFKPIKVVSKSKPLELLHIEIILQTNKKW